MMRHEAKGMRHSVTLEPIHVVIYEALCFDVAQVRRNGAPSETRTYSCSNLQSCLFRLFVQANTLWKVMHILILLTNCKLNHITPDLLQGGGLVV